MLHKAPLLRMDFCKAFIDLKNFDRIDRMAHEKAQLSKLFKIHMCFFQSKVLWKKFLVFDALNVHILK